MTEKLEVHTSISRVVSTLISDRETWSTTLTYDRETWSTYFYFSGSFYSFSDEVHTSSEKQT